MDIPKIPSGDSQNPPRTPGEGIFVPLGILEHSGNVYGFKAAQLLCCSQSFPHSHRECFGNLWLKPGGSSPDGFLGWRSGGFWDSCSIPRPWRRSECSYRDKTGEFLPSPRLWVQPNPLSHPCPPRPYSQGFYPWIPPRWQPWVALRRDCHHCHLLWPPQIWAGRKAGSGDSRELVADPGWIRPAFLEFLQERERQGLDHPSLWWPRGAPERSRMPEAQQRHYERENYGKTGIPRRRLPFTRAAAPEPAAEFPGRIPGLLRRSGPGRPRGRR